MALQTSSIKKASFISMGTKYTAMLIGLAYSVILARLLTPDEFGLVAIAQIFVTFFQIFADMGLGSAIIQRQDLKHIDISRLFSFSIVLAVALAVIFIFCGFPIAAVYGHQELCQICATLSISLFLSTLNTVPNALLMKQKRFVMVGVRGIVSAIVASAIGLLLAYLGASYMAIVVYSILNSLITFMWNFITNPIVPIFRRMTASVRKIFSYSAYLFGFNLINYFMRNLDSLLTGYFFGTADLGNYNKAYQLTRTPQTYLTSVVTPILHPILAEKQSDIDYIYSVYIKTVKILSLVGVYLSMLFYFSANEIITILYGDQWQVAVPCLQFMSISIWSQMVCGTSGTMFQVLNQTKLHFIRGLLIAASTTVAALLGIWLGSIETVSLCIGIALCIPFILLLPFLIKWSFHKSVLDFVKLLIPDLIIAVVMIITFCLIELIPFPSIIFSFCAKAIIGTIVFFAMVIMLKQGKWLAVVLPDKIRFK